MNCNHFLAWLLLLPHFFHHQAFAMFGGLGKLVADDSREGLYYPLADESSMESSSKTSSSKGIFSSIKRKYKGLTSSTTNPKSDAQLQSWLDKIYHVEATRMFLIDLNLGEEAPSFKAYSDEVTCVGELIKQFNKDMNERPGDYLSDEMKELIKEVMNQMSSVLQGSNNEELSKIAACAKALADITAAKRPASYQMTTLEKTNLGYIKALWDTYIRSSDDGKVNHLLDTLRNLWTAKV
ncbi:hypothetical protein Pst134EA_007270 [Puccinia striiformis f. sp. tritici]|uniref:Secreted protein n=1 Tax=Puccinia striiformis f. sp. tritici PST-78 TaxID=1165861 RepID=A0A0L0VPB1_9BASI|nr:hypothetical protein Pst134EA_007270 [Puccinia striiformis f. sp. tritici]KAH9470005.1 hypothetical protein Pst134EA_007270 [Puccinia striiformis f. sp. tritici]KAI9617062.1 hypothetical protein H4Q26_010700 [Puccinia striiformis f. sp. tritici PST-130]KAI9626923.1 hypothetical protein KEM48_010106 [Puccinia striiformis f. sp. tritici PST-130]KNF01114.1 hypothetical protein, variant [Puccinia striiformis f. sp. tritici PST-78]